MVLVQTAFSDFDLTCYRIAGNFRWSKFSRKSRFPPEKIFAVLILNFRVQRELLTTPLYCRRANEGRKMSWGKGRTPSAGLKQLYSAIVRSSETSAQKGTCENLHEFKSSRVQIFAVCISWFAFWSRVSKIAKIWTSRKFPAIRYLH